MPRKHTWTWKVIDNQYQITCSDCGQNDLKLSTEGDARRRIIELRYTPLRAKLDRLFPKRRF